MKSYAEQYRRELLDSVVPFWLNNSRDEEAGGYLTSLDRTGKVYDTDKFVWLQGREVWCFAMLHENVEKRPEWLEMSLHGARFLRDRCRDASGRHYFAVTREGEPLVQPYNIFSDCFAAMGYGALAKALPGQGWEELAKSTFADILSRRDNPKGVYSKLVPGTRPARNFALPMILANLSIELEHIMGPAEVDVRGRELAREIFEVFVDPETGLVRENVAPDGSSIDSFEGRHQNPGHAIEAMWFLMDLGERFGDRAMIDRAVDIAIRSLERGWDERYGGVFYFLDSKGLPPVQLEWDQKLWWVHVETLVALAKGYRLTRDPRCEAWFRRVHEYTWSRFKDPENPEWFGYLDRRGEVLLPLKGGKWKGCFHVPRGLYKVWRTLESL